MRRYQTTMLLAIITMLAAVFLASSAGATPPDWMTRQGSIGWALTQSDNTSISVDCVVIDKIKAKQQPGYFVIRECFNYRDRVVVLTQPNQALRLGMNVDVSGTLITLPNGCRAIVSPTVMGYTDEDGVLLTHGGPCIKGLLEPTPWEWKVNLTVNEDTGTMSSMSTPQTISSNDDEPNATPAEGASYYSAVADILEAQSSTQTTTTNSVRTQSYYDGIPEVRGLPDGSLVELEAKGITAVGTQNIGGTNYNYLDMIENPPATDTIRCYYTGTAAVTDRVNKIAGQIRHTDPQTPVIDIDTGPDYDPQIFEGNCQLAAQGTIAWAKTFPDGTQLPAQLEAKIVSGSFGDLDYGHFFIQEPSRASGIRVNPTDYYWYTDTGYPVTITSAQVTTINDQRALIVSSEDIENDWENWTAVNPLGMNNKWVAGGPFNVYTPGATDAFGLNNVGLLIKTWGLASNVQPSYFYINDGSDNVGVKVDLNMGYYNISHSVQAGDYAAVTGIAQLETVSNQKMRVIKPRDYYDIQVIASPPHFSNITVTPNTAGVGDTVSISFSVDHTLTANPTVTVNGHSAAYDSPSEDMLGSIEDPLHHYPLTYEYDSSRQRTVVKDGNGNETTYTYDGSGNIATKHDPSAPAGQLWHYTYDDFGHVLTEIDPLGRVFKAYTYNTLGQLLTMETELTAGVRSVLQTRHYNSQHHVDYVEDGNHHRTTWNYDANTGYLTSIVDPKGKTTTYRHDAAGRVDQVTSPNGKVTTIQYDQLDRKAKVIHGTDPDTDPVNENHFTCCHADWQKDANGVMTRFEYDSKNRLYAEIGGAIDSSLAAVVGLNDTVINIQQADASKFPAHGVISVVAPDGSGGEIMTYDAKNGNQLTSVHRARFGTSARMFTVADRVTVGRVASKVYDSQFLSRKIAVYDPDEHLTQYAYYADGHLSKVTNADGTWEQYTYDAAGNMTKKEIGHDTTTTKTTNYKYDAGNRLISMPQ